MRDKLKFEYQFYYFVRNRFKKLQNVLFKNEILSP